MLSATLPEEEEAARSRSDPPSAIFARFLKFGALAWGGPAAQIAMISRECVDEEHWVSQETFKKTLAVYQVLPGPEAEELFYGLKAAVGALVAMAIVRLGRKFIDNVPLALVAAAALAMTLGLNLSF